MGSTKNTTEAAAFILSNQCPFTLINMILHTSARKSNTTTFPCNPFPVPNSPNSLGVPMQFKVLTVLFYFFSLLFSFYPPQPYKNEI
jgi:hypothetical protein